jgi:tetratricopeptide (TPR) repeat protein
LISAAVCLAVSAGAAAQGKEIGVEDSDFVSGTFFQQGASGWITAAWTEPGRVVVRRPVVQGRLDEVAQTVIALGEEDESRLQQLAGALVRAGGALGAAARGTYVLDLEQASRGAGTRLVWSAADEPERLAEARAHIQQVAHLAYHEAKLALELGREQARRNDYEQACRSYRAALDALGDRYAGPELIDDTGLKLRLAREQERRGNLQAAAALYERILEARLTVYEQREKLPQ